MSASVFWNRVLVFLGLKEPSPQPFQLGPAPIQFRRRPSLRTKGGQGVQQETRNEVWLRPVFTPQEGLLFSEQQKINLSGTNGVSQRLSSPALLGCSCVITRAEQAAGCCDCHSLLCCHAHLRRCKGCGFLLCRRGAKLLADFSDPTKPLPESDWFCPRCYTAYERYYQRILKWRFGVKPQR